MKYQKGFVGIVLLVVIGLAVIGGGYVVYKNKYEGKVNVPVENTDKSQTTSENQPEVTPPTPSTSVSLDAALCNENLDCLIAAAKDCRATTGTMSFTNIKTPLMEGLLSSGKTKYEIKKNNTNCTMSYTPIALSVSLSAAARSEMRTKGMSDAVIDTQLKAMNDSYELVAGKKIACTGTTTAITSFLSDYFKGGDSMNVEFSGGLDSSQSIITTSSGQKVTCIQ